MAVLITDNLDRREPVTAEMADFILLLIIVVLLILI